MMWLRRVILGLPLMLLLFFAVAFVTVRRAAPRKLNQYVFGSIGEPDTLNPILSTTASASDVESRVFNGLIRFNEHLELEGELAHSWDVAQTSHLYFAGEADARAALAKLEAHRADWPALKLEQATAAGPSVRLRFKTAGTGYRERLFAWLGEPPPQPVTLLTVKLDTTKRFADGRKVTSAEAIRRIRQRLAPKPGLAERVIYYWSPGSSTYLEMPVFGSAGPIVSEVHALLRAENKENALGACAPSRPFPARDEPEITFKIRKNVRWHDGKPFTASDVLFTYQSLMSDAVASPRRSSYEDVRKVEMPGPFTARVTYKRPYSPALLSWSMGMLPAHILEGKDTRWWAEHFNRAPVGTGPYIFESWKTNEVITLRKNPNYWEGAPHLDRVVIRFIPDILGLRLSFETQEIDVLGVQPHALGTMLKNPGYEVFSDLDKSYVYVGWNLERALFQDRRVRYALAHAVNVPAIIKYVLYGQGVQSRGVFHPNYFWAKNDLELLKYDPERAKELLAEAGWKDTNGEGYLLKDGRHFEFTLITNQGNEIRKDVATLVQGDLRKVGIKVKVEIYEWAVFIKKKIDVREFDACVLGWTSPANFDQYQLWHSSQAQPGALNFVSYKNPKVDRLIELARSEFDPALIRKYCHEIQQIIYTDQPYLFLYVPRATTALHQGRFRVRRPDGSGGWIEEPIRNTKAGIGVYNTWWYRPEHAQGRVPEPLP